MTLNLQKSINKYFENLEMEIFSNILISPLDETAIFHLILKW